MKHTYLCLLAVAASAFFSSCSKDEGLTEYRPDSGGSTIQGPVEGILAESGSPYFAAGTLVVDSGKTLTIEAGTVLCFADSAALVVKGVLHVEGTADKNVRLTSAADVWRGILISHAGAGSVIRFALIDNIDVTSGQDSSRNGAVEVDATDIELVDCIIRNCSAVNGGGLYIGGAHCLVTNNIITGNYASNSGGGICSYRSSNLFFNNTICYNRTWNFGGGIVLSSSAGDDVQNNILSSNTGRTGSSHIALQQTDSAQCIMSYNFLGSALMDPKFADLKEFRLAPGSPCIDAGDPAAAFLDPDGSRNDQGAYGGPAAVLR